MEKQNSDKPISVSLQRLLCICTNNFKIIFNVDKSSKMSDLMYFLSPVYFLSFKF